MTMTMVKKLTRKDKAILLNRVQALRSSQQVIDCFVPTPDELEAIRNQYVRIEKFLTDRRRKEQQRRA